MLFHFLRSLTIFQKSQSMNGSAKKIFFNIAITFIISLGVAILIEEYKMRRQKNNTT